MKEMAENDYNLNISRYISAAIAEEEVELSTVHRDLVDIEAKVAQATKAHNKSLAEPGLPLLPLQGGNPKRGARRPSPLPRRRRVA
jgi:type I restriction enzyme M protein